MNLQGLQSDDEWRDTWKQIANSHGGFQKKLFWMFVEENFNSDAIELFMPRDEEASFQYLVALDDDKIHFEHTESTDTKSLKRHRHTRDNCKGFVQHVLAFPATDVPVQSVFEREKDTAETCYMRGVRSLFGNNQEV